MENNQEHKIDKIFKKSLENQPIIPPTDAWMGIHTYTIGQEEKKPKVWLKYASLAMLLLLISGFGVWYIVDNQKHTSKLLTQDADWSVTKPRDEKSLVKTQINALDNAGRVLNPASVKSHNQLVHIGKNSSNRKMDEKLQDLNFQEVVVQTPTTENKSLTILDSSFNQNIELTEPISYLTDNKVEIIEPKQLILNDLIDKIQKENEGKIVTLEEKIVDKKEVYKVDSIDYGSKFSLRHPIITFGIFGTSWNFWDFGESVLNRTYFPNERNAVVKLGVAWKVNKKLRVGISLGTSRYDLGSPEVNISPISSASGGTNVKLTQINSDQFYQAETPFGNVNIPVSHFKNSPYFDPNNLNSYRRLDYFGVLPHSMQITSLSLNSQYDLFTFQRKKGKRYGYQIYGLTDFNIQRQASYFYTARESYYNSSFAINFIDIYAENNHLQNASELVFGLRTGLGFRYQFARKWDFYVEGSGQHSLNNWVKSDDIKTFQRALSLQAGINLNL